MCSWSVICFLTLEILIYFHLKALEFWKTKLYSPMQKSSACLWMLQRLGLIGNRSDSLITLYLPLITCPMNQARSHGRLILKIPLDEVPKGEIMSKWLVYHIQAFEQSIHTWQLVASLFGSRITAFPLKMPQILLCFKFDVLLCHFFPLSFFHFHFLFLFLSVG